MIDHCRSSQSHSNAPDEPTSDRAPCRTTGTPCQGANSHSVSSVETRDCCLTIEAQTRVIQESELVALLGTETDILAEKPIPRVQKLGRIPTQNDNRMELFPVGSSDHKPPINTILDTGAAVTVMRPSVAKRCNASIHHLKSTMSFPSITDEPVVCDRLAFISLRAPCFKGRTSCRISAFLPKDEAQLPHADAYLRQLDAWKFGHIVILDCEACNNARLNR